MENVSKVATVGMSVKSAEEIAKQKEMAKTAYSLLGMEMPEKAEKVRKTSGKKINISELMPYEAGEQGIDCESLCRTARAYIAYKIGHTLKELNIQETGHTNFYFRNRITETDKSIEIEDMSASNAYEFIWAFYKDCLSEITDKWGILQTETGEKVFLAVKNGHYHVVMIAAPEAKQA